VAKNWADTRGPVLSDKQQLPLHGRNERSVLFSAAVVCDTFGGIIRMMSLNLAKLKGVVMRVSVSVNHHQRLA